MKVRVVLVAVVLAGGIASCGSDSAPLATCIERHGERADMEKEANYSADYLHRWEMEDGCEIRLDVLMTRDGGCIPEPEILLGSPFGRPHGKNALIYVDEPVPSLRSPEVVAGYQEAAELPEDTVDTGARRDGWALWLDPDDPSAIHLVDGEKVRRLPLDPSPPGCA